MADRGSSNRGFARMSEEKQREIASKGGRAAHQKGTAHEFTSEEAREAGRKGGERSHRNKAAQTEQNGQSERVEQAEPATPNEQPGSGGNSE